MNCWLHHEATRTDPATAVYIGAQGRFGEFEVGIGDGDLDRLLIDGCPLPTRVLRWMALMGVQRLVEKVYTGERLAREMALLDAATAATDSYALYVTCSFDVDEDGQPENVREVKLEAQIDATNTGAETWETVSVKQPSGFLLDWIKKQAAVKVALES